MLPPEALKPGVPLYIEIALVGKAVCLQEIGLLVGPVRTAVSFGLVIFGISELFLFASS